MREAISSKLRARDDKRDLYETTGYFLVGDILPEPIRLWFGSNIIGRKKIGIKDKTMSKDQVEICVSEEKLTIQLV